MDAWPSRIVTHVNDKEKDFDDVWYLEVDKDSRLAVERTYIRRFSPIYNREKPTRLAMESHH